MPRLFSIRAVLTRYLPLVAVFGIWHLMMTVRYQQQWTDEPHAVGSEAVELEKYQAIILRLNKERLNLMRQVKRMSQDADSAMTVRQFSEVGRSILALKRKHRRSFRRMMLEKQKKVPSELAVLDKIVEELKKQNIPSIENFTKNFTNEIYGSRIARIILDASSPNVALANEDKPLKFVSNAQITEKVTPIPANKNLTDSRRFNYTLCESTPPVLRKSLRGFKPVQIISFVFLVKGTTSQSVSCTIIFHLWKCLHLTHRDKTRMTYVYRGKAQKAG